ncbi:Uncharacterized protein family UPF0324 [Ammonifex degensii KC4]|uniref:Uncharacterized protein family UPF0324 n=1 Tax=Ammonifex degensii (strain DSM 10501 / KC4) TaxID=429009 RepID=C9RAR6_AMMDK|nr:putative sulfate exporter family transporter [Ammonifex degensii]ACX51343.1 Uncharacterized protein family UPF0324 [Ammonifex degensii KC4]
MAEIACKTATKKSPFITSEDWWSVYLGIFFLLLVFLAFATHFANPDIIKNAMPVEWPKKDLVGHLISNLPAYILVYALLTVLTTIAARAMGENVLHYIAGFTVLFLGAFLVLILGSQQTLKHYGLEYPFWSLVLGLIIGNLLPLPRWLRAASDHTEFYIKTGIVLLGAALPFTTIVKGGIWGFLEAALIIATGFTTAFLISRKLGLEREFAAVLGAGSSICGVSAAIAVGCAIGADQKKVGYVASLVVLYALGLIFLLPALSRLLGLNDVVAGAWIGGSELADAAGLAAAAMVSEKAVQVFTLVKLNRDVMVAIVAFILAIVAVTRWGNGQGETGRPGVGVIWERFPKFVLAFLVASLLSTYWVSTYGTAVNAHVIGNLNVLRTWLFTLAFLCIGLNTRFKDLKVEGIKPVIAFSTVVLVNVVMGFILSHLFFGGIIAQPIK